jgi:hypothetical protein
MQNLEYYYKYLEHAVAQWLRHYATTRKVAGSRSDEVNEFSSFYLILPAVLTEKSTRSREIMFLGSKVRPVRMVDNLTAICEPTV